MQFMSQTVRGATVAITGGTGSFGQTMATDLLDRGVGEVRVFSRDEAKQDAMRRSLRDSRVRFFLGDVRDYDSVARVARGADFLFHAAALKQVPSCEFFPEQAVRTNVDGSYNVITAAARGGVKSVVCLSTDKAVYPVNVMGMTKALMEKTAQAFARNNPGATTTVSLTRYGNVMYSRGSVIPLFIEQLKAARPLTITEPNMTRFMMTLSESIDLVYHAFTHAEPGDLFVRKAPAATVETLARALAGLFGQDDPEIKVIGIRHGEKLHESLLSTEEMANSSDEGEYYRVPLDARGLEYELYHDQGTDSTREDGYTSAITTQLDFEATQAMLLTVPEVRLAVEEWQRR